MTSIVKLIALVACMNLSGFLFYEGYFESTELLIIFNVIVFGA